MTDIKIEEEKWYTISDLIRFSRDGIVPFKSRSTWLELVNNGKIKAITKGEGKKITYVLQGKDILTYFEDARKLR